MRRQLDRINNKLDQTASAMKRTGEMMRTSSEIYGWQDDCLIAIADGQKPPVDSLLSLPPWRAVLVARVAYRAGLMNKKEVARLHEEAKRVGGDGRLNTNGGS